MDLSFLWPILTALGALVGATIFLALFMNWRRSSLSAELFARSRAEWRRAQAAAKESSASGGAGRA